jgi:hypothetical protein
MLFTVSIVWDVHSQSPTAAKLKSDIRDDDDAADAYAKFWCWCCFFCSSIIIVVIEMADKITIDINK